jgi:hypothetical protein
MKKFFFWFNFLSLIFISECKDPFGGYRYDEIEIREKFYTSLASHYEFQERIKIEKDDIDVFIRSRIEVPKGGSPLGIDRKFLFSSCNYFPFKNEIYTALLSITQNSNLPPQEFIALYGLAYNILYFKLGNPTKTREYYEKALNKAVSEFENHWIRFKVDQDVTHYLNAFPKYLIKNSLLFQEEDRNLLHTLKLDNAFYRNSDYIFNYINHYFQNSLPAVYVNY